MNIGRFSLSLFAGSLSSALLFCAILRAQTSSPANQVKLGEDSVPTLHESAHLVILDVSVWDWKSSPVTGLPKEAFRLSEDGHEQTLRTVEEHAPIDPSVARQDLAAIAAKLPPNTFTNFKPFADPPANVIVLDALTSPEFTQADHFDQVTSFLKKAAPGTPFIVFRLDKQLHLVQGLTMDTELLRKAVAGLKPIQVFPDTPAYFIQRRQIMDAAVTELTRYLAATPGRKTMYWYTYLLGHDLASTGDPTDDNPLHDQLCKWTDNLEQNRIDVYRAGSDSADFNAGLGCRPGRKFSSIEKAVDAEAHFYTLSYTPTNANWDGKYRKLKVDVDAKGTPWKDVKLDYRDGYFGREDDGSVRSGIVSGSGTGPNTESLALHQAMAFGAPEPDDVIFEATIMPGADVIKDAPGSAPPPGNFLAEPLRVQGYRNLAVQFAVRANQLRLIASSDPSAFGEKLEVVAVVYDSTGHPVNSKRSVVSASFTGPDDPALNKATITADVATQLPVQGSYFVRLGVHDTSNDHVGSLEVSSDRIASAKK